MAALSVGILGLSHDHVWGNLAALDAGDLGRAVVAADPNPRLRARLESTHAGTVTCSSYDALLARTDLDVVLIFADNRTSAELGVRALERGLPTMIEKPMAADLAGADALLTAASAARVPLMINWPTVWRPALRHGLTLVRSGVIGEPVQVSHRGGHAGPLEFGCSPEFSEWLYDPHLNGGGALVDYCGYGALLCRALLGKPVAVSAVAAHLRKEGLVAEDNAVLVLRHPRALGLLEASWTQVGAEPALAMIVYGDAGSILVHQPRATHEGQRVGAGTVQVLTRDRSDLVDPPPLAADERDATTSFLSRIRDGRPVDDLCSPALGRDVQEVLEAALRSSRTACEVTLPLARD